MKELVPEKANILLVSKTYESECDQKEKWYGVPYTSTGMYMILLALIRF